MIKDRVVRFAGVRRRTLCIVMALMAPLASLGFASSVLAKEPMGGFAVFKQCPRFTKGVNFCVSAQMESGGVQIGNGVVPIVNPVTLQGGYERNEEKEPVTERFVGALDGETISRTPQPVPGGLSGLIGCNEIKGEGFRGRVLRRVCKAMLDNSFLMAVKATTELAGPASDIGINSDNLINEEGVALSLPVKVHLENPLLGRDCYIGSSSDPITLNLTDGTTSPSEPNKPIKGTFGHYELHEWEGLTYSEVSEKTLVDNAFSVPAASGCGGPFSSLIDPIINTRLGLPSAAGHNTAIQNGKDELTLAKHVVESEKGDQGGGQSSEEWGHWRGPTPRRHWHHD